MPNAANFDLNFIPFKDAQIFGEENIHSDIN
jgi:hypothetical protein